MQVCFYHITICSPCTQTGGDMLERRSCSCSLHAFLLLALAFLILLKWHDHLPHCLRAPGVPRHQHMSPWLPAMCPLCLFTAQCCCFSDGPFLPSQNSYACQTGQIVMDHRSISAIGFAMSGDIAASPSSFDGGLGGQGWKCVCFFDFLNPQ